MDHVHQSQVCQLLGPDELLYARFDARDDERRLARDQKLDRRVVAAHRDDRSGAPDQALHVRPELHDPDAQPLG